MARKLLCTFPGKHGDLLWAMPVVRALAEANGGKVDLLLSPAYSSILPLIDAQPYIWRVGSWPTWQVQNSAPMTPWSPFEEMLHHEALEITGQYDQVLHLGYREWPTAPLPNYVYSIVQREYPGVPIAPLTLDRPWITLPPWQYGPLPVVVGFTDEWFELKVGLWELLTRSEPGWYSVSGRPGSRWQQEAGHPPTDWMEAAAWIAAARVFLGCCSALHVLACALGVPCVVAEPADARHHPIFWPYGKDGPQVLVPKGIDGRQTWDARHIAEAVQAALKANG